MAGTMCTQPHSFPTPRCSVTSAAQAVQNEQEKLADTVEYPEGLKLFLIIGALSLSLFLVALDNTIIATAIPKITDRFHSLDDVGWYGSAYLLTTAAVQLMFGRIYTVLSVKWVYVGSIIVFELGSLTCGVAQSSDALIFGRAIAGIGGAGIFAGSIIIIAHAAPLEKRSNYIGVTTAIYGIGSVAGPLVGGVFTAKVTWRWCFYINLPIGAVALIAIVSFFKSDSANRKSESIGWMARINQFDPFGTVTFVVAIVCLLLALQWGGSKYSWTDGRMIALIVIFGGLLSIFAAIQIWLQELATLPPRILMQRSILSASGFSFCLGASFYVLVYFLPIWFQAIKGVSPLHSGIDTLPLVVSFIVASLISGRLVTVIGYYVPMMILSAIFMATGCGLLSSFTPTTGHAHWIGFQVISGLGVGFGMQQPMLAAQTVLSIQDVPTGTSLVLFMESLGEFIHTLFSLVDLFEFIGGAIFVSVAQNVFSNKLIAGLTSKVPGVNPDLVLDSVTSLRNFVDAGYLPAVLSVYNQAVVSTFYVATAMACLSMTATLAIEWKNVRDGGVEDAMG
ncbi:major facilitator superfamily domain-containing protein [Mycena crocata]|nr:major facilitator superfamily domain-containing protein [Mycena crocata]